MPSKKEIELFLKDFEDVCKIGLSNEFRQAISGDQLAKPIEDNIKTFDENLFDVIPEQIDTDELLRDLKTDKSDSSDDFNLDDLLSFGSDDKNFDGEKKSEISLEDKESDADTTDSIFDSSADFTGSNFNLSDDDINFGSFSSSSDPDSVNGGDFDSLDKFEPAGDIESFDDVDLFEDKSEEKDDVDFSVDTSDFEIKGFDNSEEEIFSADFSFNENKKSSEFDVKQHRKALTDTQIDKIIDRKAKSQYDEEEEDGEYSFDERFGGEIKKKKKKVKFKISDSEYNDIVNYIKKFPLNIRIAVEEFIVNANNEDSNVIEFIGMLNDQLPLKSIVNWLSEKSGIYIAIPKSFEALSGEKFLRTMETPFFVFKTKILPVILKVATIAFMVGFSLWGLAFYIFPPMRANSIYNKGYRELKKELYDNSVAHFDEAFKIWPVKKQFYRYAEGYIEKRQYVLAEEFYDRMLLPENYPDDKKGRLDYGRLESEILGNYKKADSIMQPILGKNRIDYEALLETGKNFLRWGDYKYDKYELARFNFALAGENYGYKDEIIFQFLHYAIKTKKHNDILDMKYLYLDGKKKKRKIDPYIFSKLAGYFIDRKETDPVLSIFQRIFKQDSNNIYAYYQLARYNREISQLKEMEKAANYVIYYMKNDKYLTSEKVKMKILSYNMKGLGKKAENEILSAEKNFKNAIEIYEDFVERKIIHPDSDFGEIYYNLGNIFYYESSNYDSALSQFTKAETAGFSTPDLKYKKGFVFYKNANYKDALLEFFRAAETFSSNINLMYATANTLYKREDYNAAIGYYYHIIDLLEDEKYLMKGFNPDEKLEHFQIMDGLVRTYNNIGVSMYEVYNKTGAYKKYVESLANLQKATECKDMLLRKNRTKVGQSVEATSSMLNFNTVLSSDNINSIMYPTPDSAVLIYEDIPLDFKQKEFGVVQ